MDKIKNVARFLNTHDSMSYLSTNSYKVPNLIYK